MELAQAREVLSTVAKHVDSRVRLMLSEDSSMEAELFVRALNVAVGALSTQIRESSRVKMLPPNAGTPWSEAADRKLVEWFDAGHSVTQLADGFQRTTGSIASRLVRIGRVPDRHAAWIANRHSIRARDVSGNLELVQQLL